MNNILEILSQIKHMIPLNSKLKIHREDFNRINEVYSSMKRLPERARGILPVFHAIIFFILNLLPGYFVANTVNGEIGTVRFLLMFS